VAAPGSGSWATSSDLIWVAEVAGWPVAGGGAGQRFVGNLVWPDLGRGGCWLTAGGWRRRAAVRGQPRSTRTGRV